MPRTRTPERRVCTAALEVREAADGKVGLRGYAAVFDSESYGEVIRRSAFNRTVKQRDNVRLLVNHDGVPLASTGAGTMSLAIDERGLLVDAPDLDMENPSVRELVSAMKRGDISQMSFAGIFNDASLTDGVREVRDVSLWDVSVVTFPWYEETEVGLKSIAQRSRQGLRLTNDERRNVNLAALRMAPAGAMSWGDIAEDVCEAIDMMTGDWCWLCDIGDGWAVYCCMSDMDACYQVAWSQDANGITLGEPFLVVPTYVPAGDPAAAATDEPDPMDRGMSLALALALVEADDVR